MPRFSSQYKQRGPTARIISGENTYEKGMYFADRALEPGYVHTLVNLEIDQLSFYLKVSGGLHITDVASGCTFIDRAVFGQSSDPVVILQGRNEYCSRAFEGITNIISVQKLSVKNNQTLAEQIRQQGFTANDVNCFKVLTYNPINQRLMSITMIQVKRDKYFEDFAPRDIRLRRIQVNPISCGTSEVWDKPWDEISYNSDGSKKIETYISNVTDFHPNGADDHFIPRKRRNTFDETYGQSLHSPHYMQTVANCEGYGNKTFVFTKKKVIDLAGKKTREDAEIISVYIISRVWWTSTFAWTPGDIITFFPNRTLEDFETPARMQILGIIEPPPGETRKTLDMEWHSRGQFRWTGSPDTDWSYKVIRNGVDITSSGYIKDIEIKIPSIDQITIQSESADMNTEQDTYLRNCNTGVDTPFGAALINDINVPVDAYRFGILLTSVGLRHAYTSFPSPAPPILDPNDLYDTTLVSYLKQESLIMPDGTSGVRLDLNTGRLRPSSGITATSLQFFPLPVLRGERKDVIAPVEDPYAIPPVTDEIPRLFMAGHIPWNPDNLNWRHPADRINPNIISTIRVGQGFRFAAFCTVDIPLTRSLNSITGNPLHSEYMDSGLSAVFVLDYIWTGYDWDFSFIDTRKIPVRQSPERVGVLIENWESLPDTFNQMRDRITRHYIYTNQLSYTDIITKDNQKDLAKHLVDTQNSPRLVYNKTTGEMFGANSLDATLTYNIDETLDERLGTNNFINRSRLFDTAYGHFEVKPRDLQPSEAARWGYNMLHPTPYRFICADTPGFQPILTGVLLMSSGVGDGFDKPLLKPLLNTPGHLFIYFNSDRTGVATLLSPAERYQLIAEVKGLYDDWRYLKTFSILETQTNLANGQPFIIPFTGSQETILIRLTIYDRDTKIDVTLTDGTTAQHFLVSSTVVHTLNYAKDTTQIDPPPNIYDLGSALGITYWKARLVAWGVSGAENQIFMSEVSQPEYWPYPNGIDLFEENVIHIVPYSDVLIVFTSTKIWRLELQADGLSWNKTLLQQNLRISDKDIPYIAVFKTMLFFKSDKQFYMLVPQRGATVGELTIAPISKPIAEFLVDPFKSFKKIIPTISHSDYPSYKDLTNNDYPINEYLVKYGTHVEQMRVFVNWWFDLTACKAKAKHIGDREVEHEVLKANDYDDNPILMKKEYWLVQLIYDAQTYGWSIRTHTTNKIGTFISDAANLDTDFVSLIFSPEILTSEDKQIFIDSAGESYAKATWGLSIAHRRTPDESIMWQFTVEPKQIDSGTPTYSRYQIFDTGYKEVSSPALTKRFRETQLFIQPKNSKTVEASADKDYLQQLIENDINTIVEEPDLLIPYMSSETVSPQEGNSTAMKALVDAFVDGNQIYNSIKPEVRFEKQSDGTLQIKVMDSYNFIESPFTVDAELSNTFLLDQSALEGVKLIRFRRTINGKGQLIRMRFTNLTETNYALVGHAFVAHNKNAR